tara:strand:- start:144 stop:347 length:204 start_codon:yes stop_codon:yes gene_type:complete
MTKMKTFQEFATALVKSDSSLDLNTNNLVAKNWTSSDAIRLKNTMTACGYNVRVEVIDHGTFLFEEL